ncbi:MAG: fibronectin type III domain-containing protein, partial [Candidatus Marinimicrobia bacterium]|nr:fibronectin type III domain-containing protein [Candidatus Neomarinimicrobiota bacterium]
MWDNFSDFRMNALYTTDDAVRTYLNSKQYGDDWESTQTVAPEDITAVDITETSVRLRWTKILYIDEAGGYQVEYALAPGGSYTLFATTINKSVETIDVIGLTPGTTYCFRLRTVTYPHYDNHNTVYSGYSDVVIILDDSDGDGMPDEWEKAHGLDPSNPADAALDPDEDDLDNLAEYENGTDLNDWDTDGDGYNDGQEVAASTDPLDPDSYAGIPPAERAVLINLYNSTSGAGWAKSTNWLGLPGTESTWFGVICEDIGGSIHVTKLHLFSNNLVGTIPASIDGLTYLEELHLRSNSITGTIPLEVGNLANLKFLALDDNWLSGSIPAEFGNLPKLISLCLNENQLSGPIPKEMGNISTLIHLVLYENQLSCPIPPELGQLSKLQHLHLRENSLSGTIPAQLSQLSSLKEMSLNSNMLSGPVP